MPSNDGSMVWTKRGSRQGCPQGGIAFNLMCEHVLRKVRAAGEEKGIWTQIGYHPAQPLWSVSREAEERIETATRSDSSQWKDTVLADVTFVDDACLSFEANNLVALVRKASELLQIVDEVCEHTGSVST